MLKVGLIGLGGITKSHRNGYAYLERKGKAKLVCACDIRPEAFTNAPKINIAVDDSEGEAKFNFYTDLEEMLAKEELDLVDVCVPSYLHKEYAIKMLNRGYNVMCEKPMALNYADCKEMLEAEKASGKKFMIGQCVRFFPAYNYIKERVSDGELGKVISAYFRRISAPPTWGWENWFMNYSKSGGCITDLHIHDIDVIRYIFGEPDALSCRASNTLTKYDTIQTAMFYGGTPITAIGDWTCNGVKFSASFQVDFEKATAIFGGGTLTIYPKDGSEPYKPEFKKHDGYALEIEYLCDVINGETTNTRNPASSAAETIKVIELMKKSADNNGELIKF